jgi:hypothetical protein
MPLVTSGLIVCNVLVFCWELLQGPSLPELIVTWGLRPAFFFVLVGAKPLRLAAPSLLNVSAWRLVASWRKYALPLGVWWQR